MLQGMFRVKLALRTIDSKIRIGFYFNICDQLLCLLIVDELM